MIPATSSSSSSGGWKDAERRRLPWEKLQGVVLFLLLFAVPPSRPYYQRFDPAMYDLVSTDLVYHPIDGTNEFTMCVYIEPRGNSQKYHYGTGDLGRQTFHLKDSDSGTYNFGSHGTFMFRGSFYSSISINANGYITVSGTKISGYESDLYVENSNVVSAWIERNEASNSVIISFDNVCYWQECDYCDWYDLSCDDYCYHGDDRCHTTKTKISFQIELKLGYAGGFAVYGPTNSPSFPGTIGLQVGSSQFLSDLRNTPSVSFVFPSTTKTSISTSFYPPPNFIIQNYAVQCKRADNNQVAWSGIYPSTTVTAAGLTPSTKYYFSVARSCIKWDGSAYTATDPRNSTVRSTLPSDVTNILATTTTNSITFYWTAAPTATSYRCKILPGGQTLTVSTTSATFTGLAAYTVHAVKIFSGVYGLFDITFASSSAKTKPAPVSAVNPIILDSHMATLGWSSTATKFNIYLKLEQQTIASALDVTTKSYPFTHLAAFTTYTVTIYAGAADTGYENVGTTATFTTFPSGVTGFSTTSHQGTTLTFGWNAASGYNYKIVLDGTEKFTTGSSVTFYNLQLSATYTARVYVGKNNQYSTSYSETTGTTYGSPPTKVRITGSTSTTLTFEWNAPTGAVSYNLVLLGGNGPHTANDIGVTTYQFTGLAPYTEYTLEVYSGFNVGNVYETTGAASPAVRTLVAPATDIVRTKVDTRSMSFQWTLSNGASKSRVYLGNQVQELTGGVTTATFTGLAPYTEYALSIFSANQDRNYEDVGITGNYITLPDAPSSLNVTVEGSIMTIMWPPVDGADIFLAAIYQGDNLIQGKTVLVAVVEFSGLASSMEYKIVVKSGIDGVGLESVGRTLIQNTSPGAVRNLACVSTKTSLTYTWEANSSDRFNLLMTDFSPLETTEFTHTYNSLTPGRTYTLRVHGGNSTGFDEAFVAITCETLPEAPSNITVLGFTSSLISVQWSSSIGASIYQLTLSASGQPTQTTISDTTSKIFTSLSSGTQYSLVVKAGNSGGFEDTGTTVQATTLPTVVENLRLALRESFGVGFEWDATFGATVYYTRLWIGNTQGTGTYIDFAMNETEAYFDNLISAQDYFLQVFSGNTHGKSTNYASLPVKTFPDPPSSVSIASVTSTSGVLSWSPTLGATQYKVTWSDNMDVGELVVTGKVATNLTSLKPATTYDANVFSGDTNGFELVGKSVTFTTKPDGVGVLKCTQLTTNSFTLTWDTIDGAIRYLVGLVGKTPVEVATTSRLFDNLRPITSYQVVVFSGNVDGFENVGTYGTCSTLTGPPSSLIKTKSTSTSLTFQWMQVEGANLYLVELLDDGSNVVNSTELGDVNIHTFEDLTPDTHYTLKVYAGVLNAGFEGNGVTLGNADVRTTPASPSTLDVVLATSTSIEVQWNPSLGATGYHIELYLGGDLHNSVTLELNTTTHEFENLLPYSNYTVVVKATNIGGTEPIGIGVFQRTYPAISFNLNSQSLSSSSIRVTWDASANTRYCKVQLVTEDGKIEVGVKIVQVGADDLDVIFSILTANTPYLVRIFSGMAEDDFDSLYAEVSQYTVTEPLQTVSVFSASSTAITFELVLTDGTTGILVNYLNGTSDEVIGNAFITEFTGEGKKYGNVGGLTPGKKYYMELLTISTGGTGEMGYELKYTTFPGVVTNFVGKGSEGKSANLTWMPPANSEGLELAYQITRFDMEGKYLESRPATVTHLEYTNLTPGVNYRFQIAVCIPPQTPSCSTEFVQTIVSTDSISCSFTQDDHTSWQSTTSGNEQIGKCDDGYLGSPTRHCNHDGSWGPITGACVRSPSPLSNFKAAIVYSSSINLTWDSPASVTKYKITINDYKEEPKLANNGKADDITTTNYTITSLNEYTAYEIVVYSGNQGGYESVGFKYGFETHISSPSSGSIYAITETSAMLSWTKSGKADNTKLYLKKAEDTDYANPINVYGTITYKLESLQPGTNYNVKLHAARSQNDYEEPHGLTLNFMTINVSSSGGRGIKIAVPIILILLLILVVTHLYLYKKKHNRYPPYLYFLNKNNKENLMEIKDFSSLQGMRTQFSTSSQMNTQMKTQMSMNEALVSTMYTIGGTNGGTTIMNTMMEVAVPGFLRLDMNKQVEMLGPLGSGGAGTVYKGALHDPVLIEKFATRDVAIKVVHPWPNLSVEENNQRFLQEVSVIWSVNFIPNVMKLVGFAIDERDVYKRAIVTKLYDIDLLSYITDPSRELSSQFGLHIVRGICDGMAQMNNLGIVHRDLKSSNVLLEPVTTPNGSLILNPVICDFGLARIFRQVTLENQRFVNIKGFSFNYAAPEVFFRFQNNVIAPDIMGEIKADMYSLSMIIWELFYRDMAWNGMEGEEILYRVLNNERPPLPSQELLLQDPICNLLCTIMVRCWDTDASVRPTFTDLSQRFSMM